MTRPLPAWLKVLAIGAVVVLTVGAAALLAIVVPPVGDAVRQAPVVVIVLIAGTLLVLGATIRGSIRRR
ncbi:MAG: hypothetical protein ACHQ02_03040 [Candidatus Limnocylindrales bacterium]|jgi:ABC-type enterochelin transport system permease subunit